MDAGRWLAGWGRGVLVAVTIRAMDTSLIACFPDADLLVGRWRARFDPWAAHGIGAHITVASPFLTERNCVKAGVLARVAAIASRHSVVVSFASVDLLPGAIALHPSSDDSLAALTADILGAWPQIASRLRTGHSRAYHLTVACSTDTPVFNEVRSGLASALPIRLRAARLDLVTHDRDSVRVVASIPLPP